MPTILITILVVLMVAVIGLLVWLVISFTSDKSQISSQSTAIGLLQQQLESLKVSQDNVSQVLSKSLAGGQENISKSLQGNQKVLSELNNQVGRLEGTNRQMLQMGSDIRRLQDILQSPKLRGQLGEWSLENLLTTILPAGSFELQFSFSDGKTVDALIKLADYSVPVDAKFPLPNFEAMIQAEDETSRNRLRREFLKDVRKHIDKIASNYIRPAEGTLDFALMYIPAENVYYETVIKTMEDDNDVLDFAMSKKVLPVSPNLFYAYLMTVVMGLHGLQIEKQAAEIRKNLKSLNGSFAEYTNTWDVLGRHLRNAYTQYDEGNKKLNRFGMELTQIQGSENSSD